MYEKSALNNGLRIVTSSMPHTRSVSVGVFIGTGSRYEPDDEAGISHYIEHLSFKGTDKRPSSTAISEAIDGVGGILNGGTDKELTVYWCKVARPHYDLAVDVLTDMLLNSKFDPQDVEHERQVILEEINMTLDAPQQRVDLLIDEVLWPGQALGRDVAGTRETLARIDRDRMLRFMKTQYRSNNAVVAVSGDIEHAEVVNTMGAALGSLQRGQLRPMQPADDAQTEPRVRVERREAEQDNLVLAVRGLSAKHPDRFAFDLLSVILGEGMSSRLFVEIREKAGLAYDIHSYVNHFNDTGVMYICAGVDPGKLQATLESIVKELRRIREPVPESELSKVKELTKGRLLLRMEDTRSVNGWLGGQELLLDRILTVDEAVALVDKVTVEDVQRVARDLLVRNKLSLAVVGPVKQNNLADLLAL